MKLFITRIGCQIEPASEELSGILYKNIESSGLVAEERTELLMVTSSRCFRLQYTWRRLASNEHNCMLYLRVVSVGCRYLHLTQDVAIVIGYAKARLAANFDERVDLSAQISTHRTRISRC
jgi:hypothetical protein